MTTILTRTETSAPATTGAVDLLLDVLADALAACEDHDLDVLHSRTAAGTALTSLAAIARRAVAALGGDPGVHLTDGPGVVVVRDLVSATRVLARTAAHQPTDDRLLGNLPAAAKGVHAALRESMTTRP